MNYFRQKALLYSVAADVSEINGIDLGPLFEPEAADGYDEVFLKMIFTSEGEEYSEHHVVQISCSDEGLLSLEGDLDSKKNLSPAEAKAFLIAYIMEF